MEGVERIAEWIKATATKHTSEVSEGWETKELIFVLKLYCFSLSNKDSSS